MSRKIVPNSEGIIIERKIRTGSYMLTAIESLWLKVKFFLEGKRKGKFPIKEIEVNRKKYKLKNVYGVSSGILIGPFDIHYWKEEGLIYIRMPEYSQTFQELSIFRILCKVFVERGDNMFEDEKSLNISLLNELEEKIDFRLMGYEDKIIEDFKTDLLMIFSLGDSIEDNIIFYKNFLYYYSEKDIRVITGTDEYMDYLSKIEFIDKIHDRMKELGIGYKVKPIYKNHGYVTLSKEELFKLRGY